MMMMSNEATRHLSRLQYRMARGCKTVKPDSSSYEDDLSYTLRSVFRCRG
jgi:hypothetical protein